ncbi:hypothetical protein DCC79_15915 [bacterium]|nr:sigma-70 family RNA polymerase sigma factor [Chloroflexi bacterium CFX6]RIL05719.1 MAG: hypothetical protein DCC79_15915 [bacterium]
MARQGADRGREAAPRRVLRHTIFMPPPDTPAPPASPGADAGRLYAACVSPREAERVEAFETLGRWLYRALWRHVQGDPRLDHLAADCAQDALVTIWEQLAAGRGPEQPASFLGWSVRIATNKLVDEMRKLEPTPRVNRSKRVALSQQVRLDVPEAEGGADGRTLGDRIADAAAPALEDRMAYVELHALLNEIHRIRSVSANSKTVLLNGFLDGWDDAELAEHLATSARNVHVIRCRDLAKLRQEGDFMQRLRRFFA